jgi:NAD(P)-dependent dehydrogenase (short-subunit alcohol dehydrogenase family)
MGILEKKVVLVTGAAQGIGSATARILAREGAKVMVADVADDFARETANLIRAAGGDAQFVRCDVTNEDDVAKAIAKTIEAFARLDGAVNNAGTDGGVFFPTAEYPIAVFDKVMSINVRGVFLCLHHELKVMAERGSGSIVNMGSIASAIGAPNASAYIASKHAVLGLTRTAALEYAKAGIRVNAVGPGFVETPMVMDRGLQARPGTEAWQAIANMHPNGRLGKPEEVGEAVAWLLSDAASLVTGQILFADGGFLTQ